MELILNNLIQEIIKGNSSLVSIALQQHAKFEGWLKFELANALRGRYRDIMVEHHVKDINILVDIYANESLIELKTINTNYGVTVPRTITANVKGVINDINKLKAASSTSSYQGGYIAFVMFPLDKSGAYKKHVDKIVQQIPTNKIKQTVVSAGENDILIFTTRIF